MSATARPAITSRIEGAMLSRLAATATTASTASMNSSVCATAAIGSLDQVGDHVHGQRQDRQVEEEHQHAVDRDPTADEMARHHHVGDLRSHRDHEGEIEKLPVVRRLV